MNFPIPMLIYIFLIISSSVIARKKLKISIESSWNGLSSDIIKVNLRSIHLVDRSNVKRVIFFKARFPK